MEYDFTGKYPNVEPIVFALCLVCGKGRAKKKERILVGPESDVYAALQGQQRDIYFDGTRPLGQMLVEFEADPGREWNVAAMQLRESYRKLLAVKKGVEPANVFLRRKYHSGNPVSMYASIQTWEEYLRCFHRDHSGDSFIQRITPLYRPFHSYSITLPWSQQQAPTHIEPHDKTTQELHRQDTQLQLWYPTKGQEMECAVIGYSFVPLITYYFRRLDDLGLSFRQCKICGRYFLAESKRYELCGEQCRKVQAADNKREFDRRAKDSPAGQVEKNTYMYFYNRVKRIKKAAPGSWEQEAIEAAFLDFKTNNRQWKAWLKNQARTKQEYADWLYQQQRALG